MILSVSSPRGELPENESPIGEGRFGEVHRLPSSDQHVTISAAAREVKVGRELWRALRDQRHPGGCSNRLCFAQETVAPPVGE